VKKLSVFIDGSLLGLDSESNTETLGQINIAKHLLNIKENEERELAEISQITQTDIVQIDKWLINQVYNYVLSAPKTNR
jgi:hypothetical protein